jgi:predicted flap endonuclease-1-like 5' DNA nuclease
MLVVAAEIVAYLFVAALLGFIVAWALRGALQRKRWPTPTIDSATGRSREAELEARLAQREAEITALQQRLAALEQASHAASAQVVQPEHYGEIPRFLEQIGVGQTRGNTRSATRTAADALDNTTGDLFAEAAAPPARAVPSDDLKKVRGIGPRFERLLNELGVHTYKQIALWRDEDIVKYARELHTFPERVHRDEWVRSAREQHLLKYGERLPSALDKQ